MADPLQPPRSLVSAAGRAIGDFDMMRGGDRILLGLSGGKDSLSLLHVLLITQQILKYTDILVDATQRLDPTKPVIQNEWIGPMRPHAVLLDLSVDPYDCDAELRSVKGIEGIPQGNLDQYIFMPDDSAYEVIPPCVPTKERRLAASCYSWPGIYPKECMNLYGKQLIPLMHEIAKRQGVKNIDPHGSFFQRAIGRAMLSYLNTPVEKGDRS